MLAAGRFPRHVLMPARTGGRGLGEGFVSDSGIYRFGAFVLDTAERQLSRDGEPIRLNARYFDALVLLARHPGQLIPKDRFFAEVWAGVPVGDEALTQCMTALRRCLGDKATDPRFIETVPKHGYRFVAQVEAEREAAARPAPPASISEETPVARWPRVLALSLAGTLGGAGAAVVSGLFYGGLIGFGPAAPDVGGVSIFALLMLLNVVVGAVGGLGVASGWAVAAVFARRPLWRTPAAALGGATVGALTSVLGLDLFHLLLGQAPDHMTGAPEGALLGAAVALGLMADRSGAGAPRAIAATALACAAAGAVIVLAGGTLMAGSLDSLAASIARPDAPAGLIAPFFAAVRFDGEVEVLLAAVEGLLFGAGMAAAIGLVRRNAALRTRAN